ncbi:MAG: 3-isopropylmalate dehydrogenase [Alphaproteobacteria bacterium MarineAlpha6_Bin1]|nr:MAG: 3-isopropylmalate dehydrogenase [Alphaproteobacteria bacterium MarineAlpha6_Bin1]
MDKIKLLILPGDGIGPEAVDEVKKIIDFLNKKNCFSIIVEEDLVGGACLDKNKVPIKEETIEKAKKSDAVLLGAVGGPKWDNLPFEQRPEQGLLKLRSDLELFANLRPAISFEPLIHASSLKPEIIKDLDILIVRELTGGIYFGEPRGIENLGDGNKKGFNTQVYTSYEIVRVARVAFELAKKRKKTVTSVEKSNVMESGKLWKEEVAKLGKKDYPEIDLNHMYADNCAMQLIRQPKQFDIILTDNLFGDILSDAAAMLTGSLGMLPSASLNYLKGNKIVSSLYEPVHGSAPDIAGKNIANPLATIMSFSMMLKYSFNNEKLSKILEHSIINVLNKGYRTQDIYNKGSTKVSTDQMGDLIIKELKTII